LTSLTAYPWLATSMKTKLLWSIISVSNLVT
jgi:hypothetical protein